MKINVTQDHIDRADSEVCPIKLALVDRGRRRVSVDQAEVLIDGTAYALPPEAIEFVDRYDHGLPVQPIEFELDEFGLAAANYCTACSLIHAPGRDCVEVTAEALRGGQ